MKIIDSHAHISSSSLWKDLDSIVAQIAANGIVKIVDASVDCETSKRAAGIYKKYPEVFIPTIGIHPEILVPGSDLYDKNFNVENEFTNLKNVYNSNPNTFKAVGEVGLDYYWLDKNQNLSDLQKEQSESLQKDLLELQLKFAVEAGLLLVIHSRGTQGEGFGFVEKIVGNSIPVEFHSFTEGLPELKGILEQGYYVSFNAIVTYPKADNVRELFKFAWNNFPKQVLVETDAPLLAPQSKRGQTCKPYDIIEICEKLSEIVGMSLKKITGIIYDNSLRFFNS